MTSPQSATIAQMGRVSREYEAKASEYRELSLNAVSAERDYRHQRAVFMAEQMAAGASAAKAEVMADADDRIESLAVKYRMSQVVREAALEKLRQLRSQLEVGRTVVASERDWDRIHADTAP